MLGGLATWFTRLALCPTEAPAAAAIGRLTSGVARRLAVGSETAGLRERLPGWLSAEQRDKYSVVWLAVERVEARVARLPTLQPAA